MSDRQNQAVCELLKKTDSIDPIAKKPTIFESNLLLINGGRWIRRLKNWLLEKWVVLFAKKGCLKMDFGCEGGNISDGSRRQLIYVKVYVDCSDHEADCTLVSN